MLSHGRNKNKNVSQKAPGEGLDMFFKRVFKFFVYQERRTQRGYKIEGTKLVQKNVEVIENSTPTNDEKSNFQSRLL